MPKTVIIFSFGTNNTFDLRNPAPSLVSAVPGSGGGGEGDELSRVINPCSSCSRVLVAGLRHNNDKPSPLQTLITTSVSKNCNVGIYDLFACI